MRAFAIAMFALALRAQPFAVDATPRRVVPALGPAAAAFLDRAALPLERAALIGSLWPTARGCLMPLAYGLLTAPAVFVAAMEARPPAPGDARTLQRRLAASFPAAPHRRPPPPPQARAA